MRLQLLSDLHLEFDSDFKFLESLIEPSIDVAVFAGDTMPLLEKEQVKSLFNVVSRFAKEVIYLCGNHEYWYSSFANVKKKISQNGPWTRNITFVQDASVFKKHGLTFCCGTLWYPDVAGGPESPAKVRDGATCIPRAHKAFLKALNGCTPDIVVSHHLPSYLSVAPRYAASDFNRFFVYDLEDQIQRLKPRLWLHGHTHTAFDYVLGETRVICNPRGNALERSVDYRGKIIEI
jgi:Icc-related predicted phosphoesterase